MVITNKKRGLLLQRLLWLGAIVSMGCQNWSRIEDGIFVSSFAILPSLETRRNSIRTGSVSRSSLFGAIDDNGQPTPRNDDELAIEEEDDNTLGSSSSSQPIPSYERFKSSSSDDGLNLQKFHMDLEEFSDQQQLQSRNTNNSDPLVVPKTPYSSVYFDSSKILPWKFRNQHYIHSEVTYPTLEWTQQDGFSLAKKPKKLPVVVLVHGFGCSSFYWRHTIQALNKAGYTVYTTDLLGHGQSAKPNDDIVYSTQLWAEQLEEFCNAQISPQQDIVLIGNSVGSLVALLAGGQGSYIRERLLGIGMFNCGIGMNIHGITRDLKWDPLEKWFFETMFAILESKLVFRNTSLLRWILEQLDEKVLTQTLLQLYGEEASHKVDEELVRSFLNPFQQDIDAASKVLSQILTNDGGPTPREVHGNDLLLTRHLPIHVLWGDSDTVTPLDGIGGVAQFYRELADIHDKSGPNANKVTMEVIEGAGHILFDEAPETANGAMVQWLNKL